MTIEDLQIIALSSRVPGKSEKKRPFGLETLGCILPTSSNQQFDDTATKLSNATVFPLKASFRKNVQYPHSKEFWHNYAKDYRNDVFNEIAEQMATQQEGRNRRRKKTKTRRKPNMPSWVPQSQSHLNPKKEISRDRYIKSYQTSVDQVYMDIESETHDVHSDELSINSEERTPSLDGWESDRWGDPDHPVYDFHYNAILNVQDDKSHTGNLELRQPNGHSNKRRETTSYVMFQEYLRLKRMSEKRGGFEMSTMKKSINTRTPDFSTIGQQTVHQLSSFDSRQGHIKMDPSVGKNVVPRVIVGDDKVEIVAAPLRSMPEQLEKTPSAAQEPLRRSESFYRRLRSFKENFIMNENTGTHHRCSLERSLAPQMPPPTTYLEKNKTLVSATPTTASVNTGVDRCETPNYSREQMRQMRNSASFNIRQQSFGEDILVKKDLVVDTPYSIDPICAPKSSSQKNRFEEDKPVSIVSSAPTRGSADVSRNTPTTQELLQRFVSFRERKQDAMENTSFMKKNAALHLRQSLGNPIFAESSLPSMRREKDMIASAVSANPDLSKTTSISTKKLHQQSKSINGRNRRAEQDAFNINSKNIILDSQQSIDPFFVSETSLGTMNQDIFEKLSPPANDATKLEERTHVNQIEMNSPAIVSELSHTPDVNFRPITPSPKAFGQPFPSGDDVQQHFQTLPEQDVHIDKAKKHKQFYEANPCFPAYSDSVIIGRPISPESNKGYGGQEYGSIAGLSPVTCSGSQFRNSIFPNNISHSHNEWGEESVNREPIGRSGETIKVHHLSSATDSGPDPFHLPLPSQTCMPAFNRRHIKNHFLSILNAYHTLKESPQTARQLPKPVTSGDF